ncbi:unnamed protein product [Lampetra planeri]
MEVQGDEAPLLLLLELLRSGLPCRGCRRHATRETREAAAARDECRPPAPPPSAASSSAPPLLSSAAAPSSVAPPLSSSAAAPPSSAAATSSAAPPSAPQSAAPLSSSAPSAAPSSAAPPLSSATTGAAAAMTAAKAQASASPSRPCYCEFVDKVKACARGPPGRAGERLLDDAYRLLPRSLPWPDHTALAAARALIHLQRTHAGHNLKLFRKLEQILCKLGESNGRGGRILEALRQRLGSLLATGETMSQEELQAVSAYLEEGVLVRGLWRESLEVVIAKVARSFTLVLEDSGARDSPWCYFVIKVCLQIFQLLVSDLRSILESRERVAIHHNLTVILQSLLQVVSGLVTGKDGRLLAANALALSVNLLEEPTQAAAAARDTLRLTAGTGVLQIGLFRLRASDLQWDDFSCLAVCRGLITCTRKDVLLSSVDAQGCLLLDSIFPALCRLCGQRQEAQYHAFQVLWLWMRCVRNNRRDLADLVPGRRVFPDGGPRLDSVLLLLRCNWESPVEGVVESVYGCMQLLLELYARENQEDIGCCVERPLFGLLLRQALGLPWESRGRPALLRALLPHVGARTILEADADLPQQMLSCLSTNYLAPLAAELYKELLKSQRDAWESDLSLSPCATRPVDLPERKQQADTSKPRGQPGPDRFAVGVSTKSARPEGLGAAKQSDGGRGDGGRGDRGSARGDAGRGEARQDILMPELHTKESRLAEMWAGRWLKMLHSALTSGVSLLLYNVSSYLLPCTLKVFPETFALMNDHFSGPNDLLPWINLVSVARSVLNPGPEGRWAVSAQIRRGLRHRDEGVRAAALAFVCGVGPWHRHPAGPAETALLREFVPLNLPVGSSAFRQQLQGGVRRALSDLRDAALVALRRERRLRGADGAGASDERAGARSPGVLDRTVEFVDWLLDLCLNSLFPGASFQRKKMCLLLLSTLLETFSVVPQPEKKKGKPPEDVKELVSWARHRGRWDFCSQRSVSVLCVCLQDGTNEVRELAAELLQGFFPAEALLPWRDVLSSQAATLLRSPKAPEAEAGALLLKLVYHKLVVNSATSRAQGADSCQDAAAEFVSEVVATLRMQFECAQTSILEASMTMPMHGAIMALRRCLTEVPESLVLFGSSQNSAAQRGLIPSLVAMAAAISRFILRVLYGAPHGGSTDLGTDAVPSFAEIGRAVERVVAEGKGMDSEGRAWDDVLISHEHSHILSCCWLTLKEIGHLMVGLGENVLLLSARDQRAAGAGTPFFALVQTITDVLKLILTCCRHKGAIDGCSLGFVKLCGALSSHPSPALQNIPSILLEEALACVGTSSSVTRRAGALPPLVLGLVSGECRSRSHCPLLRRALSALLRLAARPLPAAVDPTRDLPQVHALHILQALFRDSSLGAAMMESAGGAALLAIRSLSSPSWAVRNGAIQLFGTLVGRMLGQMRTHDEHSPQNAVTAGEFLRHYPELPAFLLSELRAAAAPLLGGRDLELLVAVAAASGARPPAEALALEGRAPAGSGATEGAGGVGGRGPWEGSRPSGRLHLSPSLHPVLTLLSKLQPGGEDSHSLLSEFVAPVVALASDPIHDVRVLAAKTLVVMVTRSRRAPMLLALATALPERWCPLAVPQNALHGRLLQMLALLKCLLKERGGALEPPVLHSLVAALASRRWLLGEARVCPLSRALAVRLLATLARAHGSHPGVARLAASLHAIAQDELLLLHQPAAAAREVRLIGVAALRGELAAFVLTLALGAPAGPCDAPAVLRLLRCRDVDVRRRSREWLAERGRGSHGADAAARIMLEDLHRVLYEESDRRCLGLHLEACVALLDSRGGLGVADCEREGCEESVRSLLALAARGEDRAATFDPVLAARALRMAACLLPRLVSDRAADERTLPLIERWSLTLENNASDSSPDVLRLAAASSLRLAGRVAVTFSLRVRGRALPIAVRLARAAVLLLCDEEEAARLDAACFASCFSELELEGGEEEATPSPLPQQERREGEQEEREDGAAAAATGPLGAPPSEPVHGGVATRFAAAFLGRLARRRCWEALVALHGFLALPDVGTALHVHAAVSAKPLNLFEQEEGSAYGEPLALARLAAPLLEQAVVSWAAHPEGRSLLGAWLLSGIASTGSLLQHCRQFHSQCGGPAEVFAAVQQNRPYTALHILRLDLLLLARAGEALEETGPCPTLLPAEPEDRELPWDSAARGPGVLSVSELRRQAEWLNQELLAPFSALSSSKAT